MRKTPVPPWKRPAPPKSSTPRPGLSPWQKAAARQRADEAGRRYPNLVDNMWARSLPRCDAEGDGDGDDDADGARGSR